MADHNQRGTARARASSSAAPPPRDSERRRAALRDTRRWLGVGGRSWHVAPRPRAEEERPLAGAVPSRHEPTTTSAARRAREASSRAAPPPQRQRAQARLRCVTRGAGLVLEAAAGTSHHGRAPKERGLSPAQRLSKAWADHNQRGTARAQQARVLRLLSRDSERRRAALRDTRRWLGVGGRSWHVAPRPRAEGERPLAGTCPSRHEPTTTSAARRARVASSRAAPPPQRQRAQGALR